MRNHAWLWTFCGALALAAGCGGGGDETGGPIIPPPPPPKGATVDPLRNAFVPSADPYKETAAKVAYLPQNWSPDESLEFYYTPQGSQLIPYDWFLALEQPGASTALFRDNQNILRYRYLAQNPGTRNPDGLPVGFVGETADNVKWLGFTCAACHTNELHVNDVAYRVDGAPTFANVQAFISDMIVAVKNTLDDADKFKRFSDKVQDKTDLKNRMNKWVLIRSGYNRRNFPGFDHQATTPQGPEKFGMFGQLDAVGAIVNETYWNAVKNQDLNNPTVVAHAADAPVSYPFVWNAHQQDKVQWLGIADSGGINNFLSLVRNVGEVIGVFGNIQVPAEVGIINKGYPSTVDRKGLERLEDLMATLWSPLWPKEFGAIDQAAAAKGLALFKKKPNTDEARSCYDCHGEIDRTSPTRSFKMTLFPMDTDSREFDNFFNTPGRSSGKLEGRNVKVVPLTGTIGAIADPATMITHEVVATILGTYTQNPPVDQLKDADFGRRRLMGLETVAQKPKYEARPLNGIWATAPFLHNGSVPTLDALFRKTADRPAKFSVGTHKFDTKKIGLTQVEGFPQYDTSLPGNSNAGHEYGWELKDEERSQLIEYLKSL